MKTDCHRSKFTKPLRKRARVYYLSDFTSAESLSKDSHRLSLTLPEDRGLVCRKPDGELPDSNLSIFSQPSLCPKTEPSTESPSAHRHRSCHALPKCRFVLSCRESGTDYVLTQGEVLCGEPELFHFCHWSKFTQLRPKWHWV